MTLRAAFVRLLSGDETEVVVECRQCGSNLPLNADECSECGSDEIGRYRISG